jgi:hypothetical protein
MRKLSTLICFCWLLALGGLALPQNKVAEGDYQMRDLSHSGSPTVKTVTHWVLYGKTSGGYHLSSEIQNVPGGMRVVQLEDLDNQLVPVTIGLELYPKNETKAAVRVACALVKTSVTCRGDDSAKGAAPASATYDVQGPFIFWLRDLAHFDIGWQMSGALNMAHSLPAKKTALKTLLVTGGSALVLTDKLNLAAVEAVKSSNQTVLALTSENYLDWEFDSDEETPLEVLGNEDIQMDGKKITAVHYSFKSAEQGPTDFWVTSAGMLVKMVDKGNREFALNNYRQYKRLILEIKVEDNSPARSERKK